MPHSDISNEPVAGVRPARLALAAFAVLWVALAAWAVRNDDRLLVDASSRTPAADEAEPPSAALAREPATIVQLSELASGEVADVAPSDAPGREERVSERDASEAAEVGRTDAIRTDASGSGADGTEVNGETGVIVSDASDGFAVRESVDGDGRGAAVGDDEDAAGGEASAAVTTADGAGAGRTGVSVNGSAFLPDEVPTRPGADDGGTTAALESLSPATGLLIEPIGTFAVPPPPVGSAVEAARREELETLASLLADVAFEPREDVLADGARESLERAFEILLLRSRSRVDLVVESRETNDATADRRLAGERAERVVDYLVSRGIERERLSARAGDGSGLPFGEHRVRVSVEDQER